MADDWSDSDEEGLSGVETSVLLGVPDGAIDVATDLTDAAVSRIGGHPAFLLSPEPPITSCYCKVCENPMELLVQLWCPFENSLMDRALYVWGCARASCQRKQGSVRAWRGLRYNEKYAAKLARAKTSSASSAPVQLGTLIFGEGVESDSDSESEESLVTAMTKAVVADSAWASAPAYAPVYLSTVSEYIPAQGKTRVPAGALQVTEAGGEKYENSLQVDAIFERFARRVAAEGEQCVRYELGGKPLLYTAKEMVARVARCGECGAERIFECQVMPHLISVVGGEMEWGTCLVYTRTCECGGEWAEEEVYVQWE